MRYSDRKRNGNTFCGVLCSLVKWKDVRILYEGKITNQVIYGKQSMTLSDYIYICSCAQFERGRPRTRSNTACTVIAGSEAIKIPVARLSSAEANSKWKIGCGQKPLLYFRTYFSLPSPFAFAAVHTLRMDGLQKRAKRTWSWSWFCSRYVKVSLARIICGCNEFFQQKQLYRNTRDLKQDRRRGLGERILIIPRSYQAVQGYNCEQIMNDKKLNEEKWKLIVVFSGCPHHFVIRMPKYVPECETQVRRPGQSLPAESLFLLITPIVFNPFRWDPVAFQIDWLGLWLGNEIINDTTEAMHQALITEEAAVHVDQ